MSRTKTSSGAGFGALLGFAEGNASFGRGELFDVFSRQRLQAGSGKERASAHRKRRRRLSSNTSYTVSGRYRGAPDEAEAGRDEHDDPEKGDGARHDGRTDPAGASWTSTRVAAPCGRTREDSAYLKKIESKMRASENVKSVSDPSGNLWRHDASVPQAEMPIWDKRRRT